MTRWLGFAMGFVFLQLHSAHAAPTLVTGAGATFPAPLYAKWMAEYRKVKPAVTINYQSIGSGGGVRQFLAGTTDFGASDEPMSDAEIQQAKAGVIHVPTTLGAVGVTYNLPSLQVPLQLNSEVIAEVFMGKITNWNDPKIASLNSGVSLPNQPITVVYRADGSGTTAIFTEYLATTHSAWLNAVGKGKSVKFSVGIGGKGNEGVMGLVKQNPGAVGYVEMTYARLNKLPLAAVKNRSGKFVTPSPAAVTAAAATLKKIPADLRMSVLNANGSDVYPMSSYTYLLLPKKMAPEKAAPLVEFVRWAMGPGQDLAATLEYARLPTAVVERSLMAVEQIKLP